MKQAMVAVPGEDTKPWHCPKEFMPTARLGVTERHHVLRTSNKNSTDLNGYVRGAVLASFMLKHIKIPKRKHPQSVPHH